MREGFYQGVVAHGLWEYDSIEKDVFILRQNFDYFHEPDYDADEPFLNSNRECFALSLWSSDDQGNFRVRSQHLTIEEAIEEAVKILPSPVRWLDPND